MKCLSVRQEKIYITKLLSVSGPNDEGDGQNVGST